ncbi:MAG TPA: SCP2 sterol-binding domain-containing protein [Acidimicrobiales bacterium]|nr:SCP2 sterol-binding domain-containing protein [Acidimicrobiales bacterium]
MPRYLSPEWVQAFNDALSRLDLTEAIAAAAADSVTAGSGSFAVAQEVSGVPEGVNQSGGVVRTVLTVAADRITLESDPDGTRPTNVTIVLGYADALAMARGDLNPADALAAGRVRIRGELAVLVAGQVVLAAAAAQLGTALPALTDTDDTG